MSLTVNMCVIHMISEMTLLRVHSHFCAYGKSPSQILFLKGGELFHCSNFVLLSAIYHYFAIYYVWMDIRKDIMVLSLGSPVKVSCFG